MGNEKNDVGVCDMEEKSIVSCFCLKIVHIYIFYSSNYIHIIF